MMDHCTCRGLQVLPPGRAPSIQLLDWLQLPRCGYDLCFLSLNEGPYTARIEELGKGGQCALVSLVCSISHLLQAINICFLLSCLLLLCFQEFFLPPPHFRQQFSFLRLPVARALKSHPSALRFLAFGRSGMLSFLAALVTPRRDHVAYSGAP